MTKTSSLSQRNIVCTMLGALVWFMLLRSCSTRNYFSNLDLSSQTLNPAVTGFKLTGNGGQFGESVSTAGDINNDGYDDIIIGAYGKDSGRGAVYVVYGGQQSSFLNLDLSTTTLNPLTTGFTITTNVVNDYLGFSVSTAGDIDNDGYDDIIIGAYYKNSGKGVAQGAAYVIYGGSKQTRTNINLSSTTLNPASTGFMITGNAAGDELGYSVSTAGDINNDGYDDIIVGAPFKNANQGATYVIYGGPRSTRTNIALGTTPLNPLTTGFMITGSTYYTLLGFSVSAAGDINNDGFDDIIIGAYQNDAAYVIYGGPKSEMSNIVLGTTPLNPLTTGFMITGKKNDYFGWSVSRAGDINDDGCDDVIIGAPAKNGYRGAAYVIYGGPKASMSNWNFSSGATLNPSTTGFLITGDAVSDQLGNSVRTAGDINDDGYADVIIGASYKNTAYVIYGGPNSSMSNWDFSSGATLNPSTTGFTIRGNAVGDAFGYSVSTAGDINNDGYDDIVIGARAKNNWQGAAYVIYGSCSKNCKQCSSESICTQCQSSYLMYHSECFASCPDTTFAISTTTCQDCPANCNHCSSASVCTECQSPYYLYQSECLASCPDTMFADTMNTCKDCSANCNHCSSESVCTECQNSYFMYQSECFASCPDATFADPTTMTCKDCSANCNHCSSESVCTECQNSYFMYQSECFASCPDATFADATTMTCKDCSNNCNHCSSESVCTECQTSYLMYQSECFTSCPDATFANTPTTCEDCSANCNHCSSESVCTECQNSYFMYQSECFASCPDATFADAATMTCIDCPANCNHCSSESVCTECQNSYFMYQSQCFASCPDATFASTETTCGDCSANCKHCSSESVCTECQSSYFMYQAQCFASCPIATFASTATTCEDCMANCNRCSSASVCNECRSWSPY